MNIRKEKLELYKTVYLAFRPRLQEILSEEQCIILHLYLYENKGLMDIAETMQFSDYRIVKEELEKIETRILSLG